MYTGMGKARGEKGSEACSCTVRTLFAENEDLRALSAYGGIVAECGCEARGDILAGLL